MAHWVLALFVFLMALGFVGWLLWGSKVRQDKE
jgi:hypothetical protein